MPKPMDPVTPLNELAIQLHELFDAYVSAGFTRDEALELVKTHITNTNTNQGDS